MEFRVDESECGHASDTKAGFCSPEEWLRRTSQKLKLGATNPAEIVAALKEKTQCETEVCAVGSKLVRGVDDKADDIIHRYFKPKGPKCNTNWLSNVEIDSVLEQIAIKHPEFLHIHFHMRDFEAVPPRHTNSLGTLRFHRHYSTGKKTFGVVFNTDKSSGKGIHWFAVFGDFRDPEHLTLEFFDSAGKPPLPEIRNWMAKAAHTWSVDFGKPIRVVQASAFVHQTDTYSCGVYALYYIMSRCQGIPYQYFQTNRVPDSAMHRFREFLFRE